MTAGSDKISNESLRSYEDFDGTRKALDSITADHYRQHVMPRIGVLDKADYERVIDTGRMVLDENGAPLGCYFRDVYPEPEENDPLKDAGYLLQPIWEVANSSTKKQLLKESGFSKVLAELVVPSLYDGRKPDNMIVWQNGLTDAAIASADKQASEIGANVRLLEATGKPLFHYEYSCRLVSPELLDQQLAAQTGKFIDTWSNRELILAHLGDIAEHHIGIFADHSRKSAPINLGLTSVEDVEEALNDDEYIVVAHLDETTDKIDATIMATGNFNNISCVDSDAYSNTHGVYVDYLSTDPQSRGLGVASALTGFGLRQFLVNEEGNDPSNFTIAFDTAGPSTEIIPSFSSDVIEAAGFSIARVRAQSIHHVVLAV